MVSQLVNLRDVAGLAVDDGGQTRSGVLYRSDAPYPGDAEPDSIPTWPPVTVFDLRSDREVRDAHPWSEVATIRRLPLLRDAAVVTEASTAQGAADPDRLQRIYGDILDTSAPQLASLITHVAETDGPTHIHCAAGKDRTGIAVAVLLLAAGVSREAIIADYIATAPRMEALLNRLEVLRRRDSRAPKPSPSLLAAPERLMAEVINRLTDSRGDIAPWAVRHGVTLTQIASWRARFVKR
jgi:protein tyrosine/serine phosphatase